ncbi:hypothetical protein MUK15_001815 [Campylobacter coli]|nr:hypothetical protein [Campylobacter coli]
MIAYIHIGVEKTGSTSIQEFLYHNKDNIFKQNYFFPQSIGLKNHWDLAFLAYSMDKKDSYILINSLKNLQDIREHKKNILSKLKAEIKHAENIVFTSELLQSRLDHKKEIIRLKKILYMLNVKKIFVIFYIRDPLDMFKSLCSEAIKWGEIDSFKLLKKGLQYESGFKKNLSHFNYICNYKQTIQWWQQIFGKENLIVRLFDKSEFYQGDLLKDFVHSIGLKWDNEFVIPPKQNESLDLIGVELLKRINQYLPWRIDNKINHLRGDLTKFITKYFQNSNNYHLKFQPPKEIIQSYIDSFEESNEWVRKEFFPYKERLFPKQDLANYKENYELKEMKPEYWNKISEFIADIVKTKNQLITNKTTQIQNLNQAIKNKDELIQNTNNLLSFQTKYGTAKTRIQNQLSYKLGQAMILNSKSILGYLIMPMALLSIIISHKQEQKIYQEKIKKDPSLKLPPLESYPDYKEALKLKNHLSYKLGEALIQANKTWYGGGVYQIAI